MKTWQKDPDATLDYQVDWTAWLGEDTITASTWIIPTGITKASDTHTATAATVWLSGGTAGQYRITNRITTAGGRTDDRSVMVQVYDR